MYPRADGELFKVLKLENGFNVSVWDPTPPAGVAGQPPCAQQPVQWWKHYTFNTSKEVAAFINALIIEAQDG